MKARIFPRVMGRIGLAALALFLAGGPDASGGQDLTYRLKWILNTSVVGDLAADINGHFKAAGLAVTVKPGGPERDAIKELELGLSQFGAASADQVIRALSKGAPVVVLAQLFQVNPLQWIYREAGAPIRQLAQLKGMTIGVTFGGNDETILRTLLAMADLSESDVTLFSVRYDYTPFYRRQVSIWPVYRNTQGIFLQRQLAKEGEAVRFLDPAAFGVHFVANSVVTSRKMIEQEPELVRAFVGALLAGWREAMNPDNTDAVIDILSTVDRDTPPNLLREQLEVTRRLVLPSEDSVLGAIDMAAWEQTESIMVDQGLIGRPVGVARVLMPLPASD
jgi:NitT/TauT family transport system substrate-binding protein